MLWEEGGRVRGGEEVLEGVSEEGTEGREERGRVRGIQVLRSTLVVLIVFLGAFFVVGRPVCCSDRPLVVTVA